MAQGGVSGEGAESSGEDSAQPSFFADMQALAADGRNFLEAEVAFQKTRLAYAGARGKSALIAIFVALVLVIFALFALIVGILLALTPLLTAWGATAVVVSLLLIAALVCVLSAMRNAKRIKHAFRKDDEGLGFDDGE